MIANIFIPSQVTTLWGSFEIQNVRLAKIMLTQYSETNLEKNIKKFDQYANEFEELPLFFMAFHGSQTLNRVIEVIQDQITETLLDYFSLNIVWLFFSLHNTPGNKVLITSYLRSPDVKH